MECTNCAGTGTTIIAVLALILIIIFIIIAVVFFFFPSTQTTLEVRGVNFDIINGNSTGGSTGTSESMPTGANFLYMSQPLVGNLTLTLQSSSSNFVGLCIGIKNTTTEGTSDADIFLSGNGIQIEPGGLNNPNTVVPGDFAILVCTATGSPQKFTRLQ